MDIQTDLPLSSRQEFQTSNKRQPLGNVRFEPSANKSLNGNHDDMKSSMDDEMDCNSNSESWITAFLDSEMNKYRDIDKFKNFLGTIHTTQEGDDYSICPSLEDKVRDFMHQEDGNVKHRNARRHNDFVPGACPNEFVPGKPWIPFEERKLVENLDAALEQVEESLIKQRANALHIAHCILKQAEHFESKGCSMSKEIDRVLQTCEERTSSAEAFKTRIEDLKMKAYFQKKEESRKKEDSGSYDSNLSHANF